MRKKNEEHEKKRLKLAEAYATVAEEYNSDAMEMDKEEEHE